MAVLYRFNPDGSRAYGPDERPVITTDLLGRTAAAMPDTKAGVISDNVGIHAVCSFDGEGNVSSVLVQSYDFHVSVAVSGDGVNWGTNVEDHPLADPVFFRITAISGEQDVPASWDGKTKHLPIFAEGSEVPINKPFAFTVVGDTMTGEASWTAENPSTFLLRPMDLARRFPGAYAEFTSDNARIVVMG